MWRRILGWSIVAVVMWMPSVAWTQEAPNRGPGQPPGPGPGPGGGPPAMDFKAAQERMSKYFQEQLGSSDEEWKVLAPKVEKIGRLRMEAGGMFMPRFPGSNQEESRAQKAQNDLREILRDKNAASQEITRRLNAYREAREKARKELLEAQKDLKELVTVRQEAVLVTLNILE